MSGIILAGGLSSRLGKDKAFLKIGGQRLIDRVINRLSAVTDTLIIVANDKAKFSEFADRIDITPDIIPGQGPLGGLQAGLMSSKEDVNLVVSCDAPFLKPSVLAYLIENIGGADALIPRWEGRTHTILAAYRKSCLPAISLALTNRNLRIDSFFSDVSINYIDEPILISLDRNGASFFNVNTAADADTAERLSAVYDKEI